jgi:peptidyl-prolyl cis-trans isomerase D
MICVIADDMIALCTFFALLKAVTNRKGISEMLKQLRERTKTILWIVVVAFVVSIFAVWGMNLRTPDTRLRDEDAVGSVDGVVITRSAYSSAYKQIYDELKLQRGEDYSPNPMEQRMLSDQAWELAVQKILMTREINRHRITISDDELVDFIRRNPHPMLRQVFQTEDGQFDYEAYLRGLSDPEVDWTDLEMWGRRLLPELKLQTYLISQIHVSESDVAERFKMKNTEVKARYIRIPLPMDESPYEPSESEIDSLYDATKEKYTEEETRRIKVIAIEKKPTEADERDVRERLLEIRDEIIGGKDFAEMAEDYSDDQMSAAKGGDLGFFSRGTMLAEFEDAAFSLAQGVISDPVRTEYGYHLIKVEERKTEDGEDKIRARHILMRVEPGYDTIDSLSTLVRSMMADIKEKGFEKAAVSHGLAVQEPNPFTNGYFIEGIGFAPRVISFSFGYGAGNLSAPLEEENAVYFVKIVESIPERIIPKEEVRMQLADEIRRSRADEIIRRKTESIRQQILTGGSLESAALSAGLEVNETPYFKRMDPIPDVGGNTPFAVASHVMPKGEISPPIRSGDFYYLIRVMDRKQPDMNLSAEQQNEILQELQGERSTRFIAAWYDEIRQNANVVDMRERLLN